MIFQNNYFLIIFVFICSILFQYLRYRRISGKQFRLSGLLLLKILLRAISLITFLLALSVLLNYSIENRNGKGSKAMFVIKTSAPKRFILNENDRTYILSNLSNKKYSSISMNLFDINTKNSFVFVPETSPTTFIHLLEIERPSQHILLKTVDFNIKYTDISNRIELFQWTSNKYLKIPSNSDGNYFFNLLNQENTLSTSNLLQYLLILLIVLLGLDLGIQYRILKI